MGKATHGLGEGSEEAIRYLGRGWMGRKWVGKGVRRGCSRPGGGGGDTLHGDLAGKPVSGSAVWGLCSCPVPLRL